MFNNVIVGVDGEQGGLDAIALANDVLGADGELTLAFVHLGDPTPVRGASGAFAASERQQALELLAAARAQSNVEASLRCTGSPSVGRGLHELAERQHADLLVLGSTSRSLIGRALMRDDTRDALNGAPCAVAIAPMGYSQRPTALSEIGVGYDGSPESEHAIAVARKLAAQHGARISAFEAVSLPAHLFSGAAGLDPESINEFLEQARERIAGLGDVEPHAAYGSAAQELTLYGAAVDLLVVGSRSYGPIGRLIHGSVSQQLAHTARCPLLVLTRAARAEQTDAAREADREAVTPRS